MECVWLDVSVRTLKRVVEVEFGPTIIVVTDERYHVARNPTTARIFTHANQRG